MNAELFSVYSVPTSGFSLIIILGKELCSYCISAAVKHPNLLSSAASRMESAVRWIPRLLTNNIGTKDNYSLQTVQRTALSLFLNR